MGKHKHRTAVLRPYTPPQPQKDRRLRMIWNSNGIMVPSGYGIFQRDLLYRLLKDGWPVAQIAFTGVEGAMVNINGLTVYPKMGDTWGADGMLYHSRHFQANVTFSMQDVWTLNPQFLQQIRWIPYVPIDQEPVPVNVLQALKYAAKIITFSQFGHDALLRAGFVSELILEGTDPAIFKPMDKHACRAEFGIPDNKFVIGMVGANKENPPRKGWQQALEAFKLFHDNHPDSLFFFQTNQNSPGGFPIRQYGEYLGINSAMMTIDEYLGTFHAGSDVMSKLYNAWDILCHPSMTEGFGLCAIEAQSCGTPIIVNNCTSMPELVKPGETGEVCDSGFKFYTNSLGFWNFPEVKSLHEKMEKLFAADRVEMGKKARQWILDKYDINLLLRNKWIPYLENLQTEILGPIDNQASKT